MLVDTNVLVYATLTTSPHRDARAPPCSGTRTAAQGSALAGRSSGSLAVVTRPQLFSGPVPMAVALADVERFASMFELLEDGPEVGARLAGLCRNVALAGRQVHDANIVATMLAHGEAGC